MEDSLIIYLIGILFGWIILYYTIKAAVKNGIREANREKILRAPLKRTRSEKLPNTEQIKLQQRYNNGEITFDAYQTEWNRLSENDR